MKTDSENNMMNKLFSLHFIGEGRVLFSLMLLVNFQITQAICRPDDSTSPDTATPSTTLFILEGTLVLGMEQVHISQPKKRKQKSLQKKNYFHIQQKKARERKTSLHPLKTEIKPY